MQAPRHQKITAMNIIKALALDIWALIIKVITHPKFNTVAPVVLLFGSMFLFIINFAGFATHPYWWGASMLIGMIWAKID